MLLKDVLDPRLPPPEDDVANEVILTIIFAMACVLDQPQFRPTMWCVSEELSSCVLPFSVPLNTVTLSQLMSLKVRLT